MTRSRAPRTSRQASLRAHARAPLGHLTGAKITPQLIGAPLGYVGYEESGELLRSAAKGARVLIFDEISLFHPSARTVIERLIDRGTMKGGDGRVASFSGLVVLTDNAEHEAARPIGFDPSRPRTDAAAVMSWVRRRLGPRLASRLGAAAVMQLLPLDDAGRRSVLQRRLNALGGRLGVDLRADPPVIEQILARAEPREGARSLVHAFEHQIEPAVLDALDGAGDGVGAGLFLDPATGAIYCRAFTAAELMAATRSTPPLDG